MRVLVTWGSKRGGTEGIARIIGERLIEAGHEVVFLPVKAALREGSVEAAIIGGALYANQWHRDARRFVWRRRAALRKVPVWLFSSGPLDESADRGTLPPTRQVLALAELVGAQAHVTFGGRLAFDARGFPANAMAKTHAGDWRNPERIRAWATEVARVLPSARPGPFRDRPADAPLRLLLHGLAGWTGCAAVMAGLLRLFSWATALGLHAVLAPLVFAGVAWHFFRLPGARDARDTAAAWTVLVALLDLIVVAGLAQHSLAMFQSMAGTWLPLSLIFLASWLTGAATTSVPRTAPPSRPSHPAAGAVPRLR
jgi:menaquinone-dependent protoporphyrinogen oxidase